MSPSLSKHFRAGLCEIYDNSVIHSRTRQGVFTCGQYYPKKQRLDFCIVDAGIGIREHLRRSRNVSLSDAEAIEWAMSPRATGKTSKIPGGLGLKIVRKFIELNGGAIQIASSYGYWELRGETERRLTLPYSFPGTTVNIRINTADARSYHLASEFR
jgi:nitrogen-specific signal transduction histidine kinase